MKKKIVIIDDDKEINRLLERILRSQYHLFFAEEGESGIEILKEELPDLIILDIQLPDMTGYELCQKIKDRPRLCEVPVLMLSANKGADARIKGYSAGAVNYIEKPFHKDELLTIISNILNEDLVGKEIWGFEDIELDVVKQTVKVSESKIELTRLEFKLLLAFIKQPALVFSRDHLVELLYPDDENRDDRLVDSHISHLRKKIKSSRAVIKSIYGRGYKLIPR